VIFDGWKDEGVAVEVRKIPGTAGGKTDFMYNCIIVYPPMLYHPLEKS
jgi:hypothetical protein